MLNSIQNKIIIYFEFDAIMDLISIELRGDLIDSTPIRMANAHYMLLKWIEENYQLRLM